MNLDEEAQQLMAEVIEKFGASPSGIKILNLISRSYAGAKGGRPRKEPERTFAQTETGLKAVSETEKPVLTGSETVARPEVGFPPLHPPHESTPEEGLEQITDDGPEDSDDATADDPTPVVVSLPLRRSKVHAITERRVAELREQYPGLDVVPHLFRIRDWLERNPARKSGGLRGSNSRIARWLTDEWDKLGRPSRNLSLLPATGPGPKNAADAAYAELQRKQMAGEL